MLPVANGATDRLADPRRPPGDLRRRRATSSSGSARSARRSWSARTRRCAPRARAPPRPRTESPRPGVTGEPEPLTALSGGTEISAESGGEGVPVALLHGLTATRRYVVMGSRALQRSGHRVLAYDARAHGRSAPAAEGDYGYAAARRRPRRGARRRGDRAGGARRRLDGRPHRGPLRAACSRSGWRAWCSSRRPSTRPAPAARPSSPAWDALAPGAARGRGRGVRRRRTRWRASPPALRETIQTVLRQRLVRARRTRTRSPTRSKRCRARGRSSSCSGPRRDRGARRRSSASRDGRRPRAPAGGRRALGALDPAGAPARRGARRTRHARRSPGRAGSCRG